MLERFDLIIGILLGAFGIISWVWAWRKGLLNTSFERFKETYREEMDNFKKDIRGYVNKNDEKNASNMERIIELYQQTKDQVAAQTSICKVIQARREGTNKVDDMWRQNIETELNEVREDVKHIKKVINHVDK